MNVALQPASHELELTRELKARRERVFAAWTDPEQAARWWMPQEWTLVSCKMDVRPGGGWHRRMRGPTAASSPNGASIARSRRPSVWSSPTTPSTPTARSMPRRW